MIGIFKCPCCKGEIILDILASYGNFSLDVKCNYCTETGKVGFIKWFDWKISEIIYARNSKTNN